ncbi:MAG: L,D-transpeptidase family protein [Candidatus Omnitrophica bacterium]|nr:L,D-transpeptidase family protein [Candidatus Omnitrophota bacterium]MDE2221929.1 L,D-transpeptidase family protein [Candidatus Omnitrophota bacterium]
MWVFCLLAQGCCAAVPPALLKLDPSVRQAVVVHPVAKCRAQLGAWQKQARWRRIYFVSAVIGRNGLALPGKKREGDGKTPSGIYPLGPAFGYAPAIATGLDYKEAGDLDFWVDDPHSMQYNQWVSGIPYAKSFERLKRSDDLYQYAVVIGYNTDPIIPGAGSAIFLHVWRRYDSPTAGCVAVNQKNMRRILHWLNRRDQPVIILE